MNARSLARALGGDAINAHQVICPGPGHSPKDRSLSVFLDPNSPDGFRVHPHAPGDDWRDCRDHVKRLLSMDSSPRQARDETSRRREHVDFSTPSDPDRLVRFAMAIWQEARP